MAMNQPTTQSVTRGRDFGNPVIQVVLLIIVLVLFSWFIIKPKLAELTAQRSQLKTAESQLAGVKSDKEKLSVLIKELRASTDEVAKIDEALPLNGRVSKTYVLLDKLVRDSGMTLTLISADDTTKAIAAGEKSLLENPYQPGRALHTVTLTTSVTGTMDQFKNLLELIETSGRVLDVETVEVIGEEAVPKFRVTVKSYSYEQIEGTL